MVDKVIATDITDKVTSGADGAALINDTKRAVNETIDAKEESLGNPASDDMILSSKSNGTREWVVKPTSGVTDFVSLTDTPAALTSHAGKVVTVNTAEDALEFTQITKTSLGLGNVDNTSDANKPISTATQTALDNKVTVEVGKGLSTEDYTTAEKTALAGKEDGLGNPTTDGQILSSTAAGARSWVDAPSGGGVEAATQVQIEAGVDNTVMVTPAALRTPTSVSVGALTSAGTLSVAIGNRAGATTNGLRTVAIGDNAGRSAQGQNAVAVGPFAGADSQGVLSVAIGSDAGRSGQAANSVAVGNSAGNTNQGVDSVAIGTNAGDTNQGTNTVAIGHDSGRNTQAQYAIAVGADAGQNTQKSYGIAIGWEAGHETQATHAVSLGTQAGKTTQSQYAVAIGYTAGQITQGEKTVAVGFSSGRSAQGNFAVAIGSDAGDTNQGSNAVAIGNEAGESSQGGSAVAIGSDAARSDQGASAIAIGSLAAQSRQGASSIAIGNLAGTVDQQTNSIAIGSSAGSSNQGEHAIAIGSSAGGTNQGAESIAIGRNVLTPTAGEMKIGTSLAELHYDPANKTFDVTNTTSDAQFTVNGQPVGGGSTIQTDRDLATDTVTRSVGPFGDFATLAEAFEWAKQYTGGYATHTSIVSDDTTTKQKNIVFQVAAAYNQSGPLYLKNLHFGGDYAVKVEFTEGAQIDLTAYTGGTNTTPIHAISLESCTGIAFEGSVRVNTPTGKDELRIISARNCYSLSLFNFIPSATNTTDVKRALILEATDCTDLLMQNATIPASSHIHGLLSLTGSSCFITSVSFTAPATNKTNACYLIRNSMLTASLCEFTAVGTYYFVHTSKLMASIQERGSYASFGISASTLSDVYATGDFRNGSTISNSQDCYLSAGARVVTPSGGSFTYNGGSNTALNTLTASGIRLG